MSRIIGGSWGLGSSFDLNREVDWSLEKGVTCHGDSLCAYALRGP